MTTLVGYCPWCGRWDSLYHTDGLGIVCTTRRFRGAEVSCLWGAWQLRGITSRYAYQKQALLRIGTRKGIADGLNAASETALDEYFHNDVAEKIIAYVIGSMWVP